MARFDCMGGARAAVVLWSALLISAGGCAADLGGQRQAFDRWYEYDERAYEGAHAEGLEQREVARMAHEVGLPDRPELADYIAYAKANNPGLRAAFERWHEALQEVVQAGALPDPQLSYSYFVRESMTQQTVGLVQTFPWWGRLREEAGAALEQARAAEQRFETERLAVVARVKEAYAEYAYLREAVEVKREHVAVLGRLAEAARAQFEAGTRPWADVAAAELAQEQLEDALQTLKSRREPIVARLNAPLGERGLELAWPKRLPRAQLEVDEEELIERVETNPRLAAQRHETARQRRLWSAARQNRMPDVTVGVEYMDMTMRDMRDQVALMGSINLPIWGHRLDAERAQRLAGFGAATREQDDLANELEAELRLAVADFGDLTRRAALFGERLIPMAERTLEASRAAYAQGELDFQSVAEAQAALQEIELSYRRVRADQFQELAGIEQLVGGDLGGAGRQADFEHAVNEQGDER